MKVDELEPLPSTKFLFRQSAYKSIPKISGCYVLATFTGDILYIGLADNLYNRFQQHLNSHDKIGITDDGKATWFYFLEYDADNLPKLERTWLNRFEALHGNKPVLNKNNSPVS